MAARKVISVAITHQDIFQEVCEHPESILLRLGRPHNLDPAILYISVNMMCELWSSLLAISKSTEVDQQMENHYLTITNIWVLERVTNKDTTKWCLAF